MQRAQLTPTLDAAAAAAAAVQATAGLPCLHSAAMQGAGTLPAEAGDAEEAQRVELQHSFPEIDEQRDATLIGCRILSNGRDGGLQTAMETMRVSNTLAALADT